MIDSTSEKQIWLEYKKVDDTWVLVNVELGLGVKSLLGGEIPVFDPHSKQPHRLHIKAFYDLLAKVGLDGGSSYEEYSDTDHKMILTLKRNPSSLQAHKNELNTAT